MSILVEIAGKADVSVEGVVRVLTREPVSSAVKERVLAVLDQLDAEQTRVLERFALAAVHDVVPLDPDAEVTEGTDAPPEVHEGQLALGESPASAPAFDSEANGRSSEVELPPGLGTLLEELVGAVWEIRHESRSNRQERLDDLAVLVDLMTTSWQGVDRRLARLEQLLARREARWQTPMPIPAQFERTVPQPLLDPVPPPAIPPGGADADAAPSRWKRGWPPFAGTLLLVLCVVGVMLAFDLLPSRAEGPTLLPARENGSETTGAGTQTTETGSSSTVAPSPRSSTPARTTAPTTTRSAPPQQAPAQPPRGTTTGGARPAAPPAPTTTPTTPTTTGGTAIQPARVFVWPPVEGASAYSVRFFREGQPFYTARVAEPRLAIPKRIVFTPGAYSWLVRPVTGSGLGDPIIESTFSVARP